MQDIFELCDVHALLSLKKLYIKSETFYIHYIEHLG